MRYCNCTTSNNINTILIISFLEYYNYQDASNRMREGSLRLETGPKLMQCDTSSDFRQVDDIQRVLKGCRNEIKNMTGEDVMVVSLPINIFLLHFILGYTPSDNFGPISPDPRAIQ